MILCSGRDVLCLCVCGKRTREVRHKTHKTRVNEILKNNMYIGKENMKYKM